MNNSLSRSNSKRKCSFSSFNECRYVEDGGKTTKTYFFSADANRNLPQVNGDRSRGVKPNVSDHIYPTYLTSVARVMKNASSSIKTKNVTSAQNTRKRNIKQTKSSAKSFHNNTDIRRNLFVHNYKERSIQSSNPSSSRGSSSSNSPTNSCSSIFGENKDFLDLPQLDHNKEEDMRQSQQSSTESPSFPEPFPDLNSPKHPNNGADINDEHPDFASPKDPNLGEDTADQIYLPPKEDVYIKGTSIIQLVHQALNVSAPVMDHPVNGQTDSLLSMTSLVSSH